jgi:phage-related protein
MIVWQLDLQLHVQSRSITTKVVISNPVRGEVYSKQHSVIKFVSDLLQVRSFHWVLRFPPPIKFVSDLLQVRSFHWVLRFPPPIKFVSDLLQVRSFHWVLRFPPPIKETTTI